MGEEIGMDYVTSCLQVGIELWNHAIQSLEEKLSGKDAVLQLLDKGSCENLTEKEVEDAVESVQSKLSGLKKICISDTAGSLELLVCSQWLKFWVLLSFLRIFLGTVGFFGTCMKVRTHSMWFGDRQAPLFF